MRPNFKKFKYLIVYTTFILTIWGNAGFAQTMTGYTRKSISHTTTVLSTDKISLSSYEEQLFIGSIKDGLHIPRFDYNPLPDPIQTAFKKNLSGNIIISEQDIESVILKTLVPEIIYILDINKELRAQNLITEAQKNAFISTKAKDSGITSQQLEQVMNSSYIYIPYISKYKAEENDDKKEIHVSLAGGVLWYHIITGENPGVEKIAKLSTEAYFDANTDESFSINGRTSSPKEYAFWNATNTMTMNLEILTRELDMFKLSTPILEIQRRKIGFQLGRQEGIRLDDPFFVGEWYETQTGKVKFKKSGFVRVSTVADNRNSGGQLSQAVAIKKGDWSRGMMMIEHPRLGVDIAIRPRWFEVAAESGYMTSLEKGFVVYFGNYSGGTLGLDMNFQWNIANLVQKRQTFITFGGTASLIPVKSIIFDYEFWDEDYTWRDLFPVENWVAGLYYGYIGYMKRYYLGPFAIHGEACLGTQVVSTGKVRGKDFYNDGNNEKVTVSNYTAGIRLNVGLEYAVSIDCNVGIFAGVQAFPPLDWWTIKYDDKEIDIDNNTWWIAPKFYSYSQTFGIYIHFSPPTMPFNPTAIVQNQMKNIGNNK